MIALHFFLPRWSALTFVMSIYLLLRSYLLYCAYQLTILFISYYYLEKLWRRNFLLFNQSFLAFNILADLSPVKMQTPPDSSVLKHKKNFKIWFSPRSRKVRCMAEKPLEVTVPESRPSEGVNPAQPCNSSAQTGDLSVFNFASSSQDSSSSCSQRSKNDNRKKKVTKKVAASKKNSTRTSRKQSIETVKKNRLEAINQQWGITEELKDKEGPCLEGSRRSSKRVSFQSPAAMSDEPHSGVPQVNSVDLSPGRSTVTENPSEVMSALTVQSQAEQSDSVVRQRKLSTQSPGSNDSPDKLDNISPVKHPIKRSKVEEKVTTLETTPKRPRASPGKRRKSQMSPVVLNPPSSPSPTSQKSIRNCKKEQAESPLVLSSAGRKSPSSLAANVGRPSPGSPAVMKRNHKGETPLHVASIKVKKLMDDSPYLIQQIYLSVGENEDFNYCRNNCSLFHCIVVRVR